MNKAKSYAVLGIIIVSLLPVYMLLKYLRNAMQPRESWLKFLLWMLTMLLIIFGYTFLLVFVIRVLFPGA